MGCGSSSTPGGHARHPDLRLLSASESRSADADAGDEDGLRALRSAVQDSRQFLGLGEVAQMP